MLLSMLAIAESRRVQQYGGFVIYPGLNSGASAGRAGGASANSGARNLELTATLADPSAQELARFAIQQMGLLLEETHSQTVGGPELQEKTRWLADELRAMIADPLLQEQVTLVAEQLEEVKVDANFQKQAKQLLEQATEVVTQMQTMMTDLHLQDDAGRLYGMRTDGSLWDDAKTLAKRAEAMEAIMANPKLQEPVRRLFKGLEAMKADQSCQDQATPIAQLMETLIVDPNFQRHARRIAAHAEAIRTHLTFQRADDGPPLSLFSLAEVSLSSSKDSFVPPSLPGDKLIGAAHWRRLAGAPRWRRRLGRQSHSSTPGWPLASVPDRGGLAAVSMNEKEDGVRAGLVTDVPFEIRFSVGNLITVSGAFILAYTLISYFVNMGSIDVLQTLGLVYGIPALLGGLALKYAELPPVPLKSSPGAEALREQKGTKTQRKILSDATRFTYGDAHMEEPLKALKLAPRGMGPPILKRLKESVTPAGGYALGMTFYAPNTPYRIWKDRAPRYARFFGPGVRAVLRKVDVERRLVELTLATLEEGESDKPLEVLDDGSLGPVLTAQEEEQEQMLNK